jgi:hypothetical protein
MSCIFDSYPGATPSWSYILMARNQHLRPYQYYWKGFRSCIGNGNLIQHRLRHYFIARRKNLLAVNVSCSGGGSRWNRSRVQVVGRRLGQEKADTNRFFPWKTVQSKGGRLDYPVLPGAELSTKAICRGSTLMWQYVKQWSGKRWSFKFKSRKQSAVLGSKKIKETAKTTVSFLSFSRSRSLLVDVCI